MHLPSDSTAAVYTGTTAPSTDWTNSNHHQHTASITTSSLSGSYTKGGMLSEPPRHSHNHNSDNNGNSTNSSNNNNNANTTNNNNITSNSNNSGSATSVGSASPSSNNVNNELWWTNRLVLEAQQEFPGELG